MNFKSLTDAALHESTLLAAATEKKATLVLLEYLAEVDERRLYNARGYSTLWEYVHKALGYSEAQASERVSAMRLMRKVPEVRAKLERQELTLTSTAKLAAFVKREECSSAKTIELLEKISEKPVREVERVLVAEQSVPVSRPDVIRPTGPETHRVSFDADPEFMALFEELRNLDGNPAHSMSDLLKRAMKEMIKRKKLTQVLRAPEVKKETLEPESIGIRSRYLRVADRRAIASRSMNQCEYVDTTTGFRSPYCLQALTSVVTDPPSAP